MGDIFGIVPIVMVLVWMARLGFEGGELVFGSPGLFTVVEGCAG